MPTDSSDGIVVDANTISLFIQDHHDKGGLFNFITFIADKYGIAINNIIEQEWINTAGNEMFWQWYSQRLAEQKIVFVSGTRKLNKGELKKIHNRYGFPKSRDIEYIKCSINTKIMYIITGDMDFYDPKRKVAKPDEREKLIGKRKGKFCKFLLSELGIRVGLPQHCSEDLKIVGILK